MSGRRCQGRPTSASNCWRLSCGAAGVLPLFLPDTKPPALSRALRTTRRGGVRIFVFEALCRLSGMDAPFPSARLLPQLRRVIFPVHSLEANDGNRDRWPRPSQERFSGSWGGRAWNGSAA
jgi:hypothetical protein